MAFYSAGVEYGIHCLLFLVDDLGDSREASVRELADLQGVPHEYLAKIFTKLAKAGLVIATEGVRGGFRLGRLAQEISMLDIAQAIDGRKAMFECREVRGRCALFEGDAPPSPRSCSPRIPFAPIGLRPLVQGGRQNRRWLEAEVDR